MSRAPNARVKVRRTTGWSGVLLALCATTGLPAVARFPSEAHRAKEGPDGLVLSPDGKLLYVAESFASRILLFDVAADGSLSGRREFLKLSEVLPTAGGRTYTPDGLRIDRGGNLFVGFWDGACFAVIGPDGKLIKQVDLPAPHDPNLAITPDGASVILTGVFDLPDNGSRGELYRVTNPVTPK